MYQGPLEKIDDYRWRIPKTYMQGMRVPGIIYANGRMIDEIRHDKAPEQVANAAFLPGIVKYSIAMPDIHWGYGLCIGGVVATDVEEGGVISPGSVGFDVNCGIRLMRTNLRQDDVKDKMRELIGVLFDDIPCGVGSSGDIKVSRAQEKQLLVKGARWAVEAGYGVKEDLVYCEENGEMKGADPDKVTPRAYERGSDQSGTLGSGNHFIEVQQVAPVYDEKSAALMGIGKGMITVMIHSGSRGFGHQTCDDYSRDFIRALSKYNINIPDRQLACAPVNSQEGKAYLGAMACAANYAWANRQCLMHLAR